MGSIEKTVFISYRRKDISWALLVYHSLTANQYDVFFDYTSIPSGDFEQIIISNIKARAHFLVILTPSALDRCNNSDDWLRREIETAISEKRNIIPMFFDGFKFDTPSIARVLAGRLAAIKKYNGLEVPATYFEAAMERLRNQFLNVALDAVLHPVSDEVRKVVREQKIAADEAILRQKEIERSAGKRVPKKAGIQPQLASGKVQADKKRPDRLTVKDFEFCHVPAGPFLMGTDNGFKYDGPQHIVDIPYDYWVARFPVTNEQYHSYTQSEGKSHPISGWKSKRDHPVVSVPWHDAMTYCHWLNEFLIGELPEGRVLRLPTEAEWEKAARGADGRNYPWGNSYNEDNTNCRKGRKPPYGINTTPVGAYSPGGDSPYGCGDMIGNVSEWTHSLFKPYPYRIEDGRESEDVIGDKPRVLRGGSWYDNHFDVTSRYYRHPPNYTWDRNGFRVVLAPKFQF